ncbi:head completion/stabilization protein [Mannheimia bovis]|uniref:Head completion/stabilization protein n=1 Tax=Mannheimia bovis TaxID=2770636 RepID=A0A7H1BZX2_9PAST|nr:head completion/stabilization protein [Mannheimia bovis]QNS14277.1 head completion/stabilization protein [Mannheimia bovis]
MFNGRTTEYDDITITNNGFWPDVNVQEFQKQRAIPFQIPVEMVRASLISAMQQVNLDLVEVEKKHLDSGIENAEQISASTVGGENYAQTLYKKAVFARAKHELLPEFNTLSARELHEKRQYVEEQKSLLAEATHAIRVLKGKNRGSVCLI